ncbi:MAG TPA: efflux RND transporter periplasmic adaptor subunit [Acidocella sp.]|nr:efflux RND transporter periplasmic adaptor subunit [Acidocella sp.]
MADQDDMLRYNAPPQLKLYFSIAAAIFTLILVTGIFTRVFAAHKLAAATASAAIPTVALIAPSAPTQAPTLVLPGNVKAFYEAPIYAQVSGYLQSWTADIGARVKAGEVLGTISTPNLDQQLAQAEANLNSAIASEKIAATTANRWNAMRVGDAVSQQDADQKNADNQSAHATTEAARAAVAGYQAQVAFKQIVAPFDGIVTARNTDIGDLVTTGGTTPLFVVDDEARLRIYVSVPEAYAAEVKQSSGATFTVPDYPGRTFRATLAATAGAIDPTSGTLLVQFQADNQDGALQAGDYAQVTISLPANGQALSVPSSALMFRDNGMEVATLGPDNRVVIKPVTIGRDFGNVVQIATGISKDDRIINNPPDALEAGDEVQVAQAKTAPSTH